MFSKDAPDDRDCLRDEGSFVKIGSDFSISRPTEQAMSCEIGSNLAVAWLARRYAGESEGSNAGSP
jgi:hypothetical protein